MKKALKNVVVVAYGRSAVGKSGKKGALRNSHPVEYGGLVLKGVLERCPKLDPAMLEDVIVGAAIQEGPQGFNMARMVASRAGIPHSVPAVTVNRFCCSGLQTMALAAAEIEAGLADCIVAGGVESMSAIPMSNMLDHEDLLNDWILENDPELYISMGLTAENVAAKYGITREEMEQMAVDSHRKAAEAQEAGRLAPSIIPVPGVDVEGNPIVFDKDQGIRKGTTMESLAQLKPCFKEDGVVTAAVSSQTSDGAGFAVLMAEDKAKELGIKPIARFLGYAIAGCEPELMGMGPAYAVPKVMELTGLTVDDMDVIEINEAFASQAIACIRELKMDYSKVNPNGGAMALGHPLGATGGVLTSKALDELERIDGKYALITMCVGGGMGAAGVFERIK